MSQHQIRIALESRLGAMSPVLSTAHENQAFTPVTGVPYQQVSLLPAQPANPTLGDGFYRELGLLLVSLRYPQGSGPAEAQSRAEALRAQFPRGRRLQQDGIDVLITRTPEIAAARTDGDRYVLDVFIRYQVDVFA